MRNSARSANGQNGLSYQSRTLTRRLNHLENFLKKNNQQYLLLKFSINETHSVQFFQGAVPLLVSFLQRKVNQLRIGADRMSQLAQKMAWQTYASGNGGGGEAKRHVKAIRKAHQEMRRHLTAVNEGIKKAAEKVMMAGVQVAAATAVCSHLI